MSKLTNNCQFLGNVGATPKTVYTETQNGGNNESVYFSLCVNQGYKKNGQEVKQSIWIDCACYSQSRVTYIKNNVKSGSRVMVVGYLISKSYPSNKYFDKEGNPMINDKKILVIEDFVLFNSDKNQNKTNDEDENQYMGVPF